MREFPIDPFSSGISFTGWRELARRSWLWRPPPTYQPLRVCRPRTWLLERGWQLAGSVGTRDVPGETALRCGIRRIINS